MSALPMPPTTSATTPRSLRVGQWLMLLVSLAGLLAMHGLSDHGAVGSAQPLQPSTTHALVATIGPATHLGHARVLPGAAAGVSDERPSETGAAGGQGHAGHDGALSGGCLAVMAGLVVLVLARWPRRVPAELSDAFRVARASAVRLRHRSRRPAAPDLRLLSVQRC